jgi:tRNA(Arg) A34 adenosine deaminase TadA
MNPEELKVHERFLRRCIELSVTAIQHGNQPFGSVLVKDGEIILEAENTIYSECDCTGHAETNVVRQASMKFDKDVLEQSTLYTSTEPCVMCCGAIYWAGIPRMVYACSAYALKELIGDSLLIPSQEVLERGVRKTEILGPILEEESLVVHRDYWFK